VLFLLSTSEMSKKSSDFRTMSGVSNCQRSVNGSDKFDNQFVQMHG
jgi:hypothetical protein